LKKLTLTSSSFSMFLIFNIDIASNSMFQNQYIKKLLNVFNVSMFLNFIQFFQLKKYIFGQKGGLNFNFRTNFTLLIKNRKPNMGLNICLLWTIFCYLKMLTIFQKISTLKHWNQHWNIEINIGTLNRIQCWNFEKHWHRIEFQCSFFWHWKHWIEINVNVGADP